MCDQIKSGNKIFVLLNHRVLINEAYSTSGSACYKLRSALFAFNAKTTNAENAQKRKRKKPQKNCVEVEDIIDKDLLQAWNSVANKLPTLLSNETMDIKQIPRVWEELQAHDFPKFKGANSTATFQSIESLVQGKRFLIPPNTQFYNYDVADLKDHLSEFIQFDLIVLDPPWRNKYIRRLKKHNLGYDMLENENLQALPIRQLIHQSTVVAIWCTNSKQHQAALLNDLLPAWNLRLLHTLKWLKLNTRGQLISTPTTNVEKKQPYEHLYIACHQHAATDFGLPIREVDFIASVPSVIHSHKPPLLTWLQTYFNSLDDEPKCLELFARYLQPHFTSFGLEVLKLMDYRLYEDKNS